MFGHVRGKDAEGWSNLVLENGPIIAFDVIEGHQPSGPLGDDDPRPNLPVVIDPDWVPDANLPPFRHHLLFGTLTLFNLGLIFSRNVTNYNNGGYLND